MNWSQAKSDPQLFMGRKSREKKERRQRALAQQSAWTPFVPATVEGQPTVGIAGETFAVLKNNRYTVLVRKVGFGGSWPNMIHLSIKRNDREWIHDWRDLQRIKNEIVGLENEAVELYPAESRLVDGANQYHLWVLEDPELRFPFGYRERLVSESRVGQSKQRPWPAGEQPKDLTVITPEDIRRATDPDR